MIDIEKFELLYDANKSASMAYLNLCIDEYSNWLSFDDDFESAVMTLKIDIINSWTSLEKRKIFDFFTSSLIDAFLINKLERKSVFDLSYNRIYTCLDSIVHWPNFYLDHKNLIDDTFFFKIIFTILNLNVKKLIEITKRKNFTNGELFELYSNISRIDNSLIDLFTQEQKEQILIAKLSY